MSIYLVLFIGVFGCLGVWIRAGQIHFKVPGIRFEDVISHLATVVIAISVTTFADFLLNTPESPSPTKLILMFGLALLAIAAGVCALVIPDEGICFVTAKIGAALAVVEWIWVNSTNPHFGNREREDPRAILGGLTPEEQ